jgi:hypothetical protein
MVKGILMIGNVQMIRGRLQGLTVLCKAFPGATILDLIRMYSVEG